MEEENFSNDMKPELKVPQKENKFLPYIYIFLITFVVMIIFVSAILNSPSSKADLDIGENPVASMNQRGDEEYEDNIRAQIDQRLKMIQEEEEMPGVSEKANYTTPDDIVNRLRGTEESKNTIDEVTLENVHVPATNAPKPNTITKIYIGQFSDMQKAVEMQSNILNSGVNVTPVIKEVNGYYTIQAGAFSNYESARAVAEELNNAGFGAKVVKELR